MGRINKNNFDMFSEDPRILKLEQRLKERFHGDKAGEYCICYAADFGGTWEMFAETASYGATPGSFLVRRVEHPFSEDWTAEDFQAFEELCIKEFTR